MSVEAQIESEIKISRRLAIVMAVLGFLAVFLPFATGISVSILVAWIIVSGGIAHLVHGWAAWGRRWFGSFRGETTLPFSFRL